MGHGKAICDWGFPEMVWWRSNGLLPYGIVADRDLKLDYVVECWTRDTRP